MIRTAAVLLLFLGLSALVALAEEVHPLLASRPLSGNLLQPALEARDYEERVHAGITGWTLGATLGLPRNGGAPDERIHYPLDHGSLQRLLRVPPPPALAEHILLPLETLVATEGEPAAEDYERIRRRFMPEARDPEEKSKAAPRTDTDLFTGAFVLGLTAPGLPDVAAERVLRAYGDIYAEESLVPAVFIASSVAALTVDDSWMRSRNAGISQIPRAGLEADTIRVLRQAGGSAFGYPFYQKDLHNKLAVGVPWSDPLLNLSSLVLAQELAPNTPAVMLQHVLAGGYQTSTNGGIALGMAGAREGLAAFPVGWRQAARAGIVMKARNVPELRTHSFERRLGEEARSVEIPLASLTRRIAEVGRRTVERQGGAVAGEEPEAMLVLPRQANIDNNLRQLTTPFPNLPERVETNRPLAEQFDALYSEAVADATAVPRADLARRYLDLSQLAVNSRYKVKGRDATRILEDWWRVFGAAAAEVAGWEIHLVMEPSRVAPGDSAELTIQLRNLSDEPLESLTFDLQAGAQATLQASRPWRDEPVGPGGMARAVYSVQTDAHAPLGPLVIRGEARIQSGTALYRIPIETTHRVVEPFLTDARINPTLEGTSMLTVTLRPEPDTLSREQVAVRVTGLPDGLEAQPARMVRNLEPGQEMETIFHVAGLSEEATHAWYPVGLEVKHGNFVASATRVLQLGPILQVDRELAVPLVDLFWNRRAFRVNPDHGAERLVYAFETTPILRERGAAQLRFDYLVEAAKDRKMRVEYPGEGGTKAQVIELSGDTGWNSVTFSIDDLKPVGPLVEFVFRAEDGQPFTAGRLRPAE